MKSRSASLPLALAVIFLLVPVASASSGGPTADSFQVAFFHGSSEGNSIRLTWETLSEGEARGFNVYRADQLYGPRVKLNDSLIAAKYPGSHMGAAYELVDKPGSPRILYHYWLETVDNELNTVLYGPVQAYVSFSRQTGTLNRTTGSDSLRQVLYQP
jgi:hypothetical protein